jgi:hypothetical protein
VDSQAVLPTNGWIDVEFFQMRQKEVAMTEASGNRRSGMFGGLFEWWHSVHAARARLDGSPTCDDDIGHIARNAGLLRSDLYTIAAKRSDATDRLRERLEMLHIAMTL